MWPTRCLREAYRLGLILALIYVDQAIGSIPATKAQYIQNYQCEVTRLIRCQQDVLRDLQAVSLNAASIQYPIGGPPYSPIKQHIQNQQLVASPSSTVCRLVRSNLDCLLGTTPACYDQGIQTAQNTDIILRAKRFLEQNNCNEPDATWQSSLCYRSPEIRGCEERYGFSTSSTVFSSNVSACLAYHAYKFCVESHLRLNCKVNEIDMVNEYLIDRASDLAWRCPVNATSNLLLAPNPYQLSRPSNILSPSLSSYSNYGSLGQHPIPTYVGGVASNPSVFRDQAWERFNGALDDSRLGISRYPAGEVLDRLVASNIDAADASDCPVRAAPYARECEDTLLEQQRVARDSRDGNELTRRICCSLFQYRDCVSRVVLDRCADSSPTAVEILMGVRRRELTLTCRSFNRDVCSGSLSILVTLNLPFILFVAISSSLFMTFKQL